MTNPEIQNRYLRALLAHELLGYRKSHWALVRARVEDQKLYVVRLYVCRNSFGRIDLHLRRHGEALVRGDPTPLKEYSAGFAGHN